MAWIFLDDVKTHLNKTTTADDAELAEFMDAACAMIEDIKGVVQQKSFTETQVAKPLPTDRTWLSHVSWPIGAPAPSTRRWLVALRQRPVYAVTTVTWTDGVLDLFPNTPDVPGWMVSERNLYVPYPGTYTVTYDAGYAAVPPTFRMAALELVSHLWRSSQNNSAGGRPRIGVLGDTDQMVMPGQANALPYRVRELLGLYGGLMSDDVTLA